MTRPVFPNEPLRAANLTANPMTLLNGLTPSRICRDCDHLIWHNPGHGHNFYKCDLRKITSGAATDHRVRWPACGRFVETA